MNLTKNEIKNIVCISIMEFKGHATLAVHFEDDKTEHPFNIKDKTYYLSGKDETDPREEYIQFIKDYKKVQKLLHKRNYNES